MHKLHTLNHFKGVKRTKYLCYKVSFDCLNLYFFRKCFTFKLLKWEFIKFSHFKSYLRRRNLCAFDCTPRLRSITLDYLQNEVFIEAKSIFLLFLLLKKQGHPNFFFHFPSKFFCVAQPLMKAMQVFELKKTLVTKLKRQRFLK